jgi:hypothetical protein
VDDAPVLAHGVEPDVVREVTGEGKAEDACERAQRARQRVRLLGAHHSRVKSAMLDLIGTRPDDLQIVRKKCRFVTSGSMAHLV